MSTIKRIARAVWTGLDGLRKVLHLIVLLLLFVVIGGALTPAPKTMPSTAALVISPTGTLVEQLEGDPFDRAVAELVDEAVPQTLLRDIVDGLRYAKTDDRIKAVLLELGALTGGGLSKMQRVAEAIEDFRESGKPVIASADFYSQGAYYIAAGADEIYMHPDGMFLPQGFGLYSNYFADAIEKLRIDWNIFRVGTHKSAVEPFTRMDMSEEDAESRSRLVKELWTTYRDGVESARGLDAGTLDDFANDLLGYQEKHQGDLALAAAEAGFFDGLVTRVELQNRLVELVGEDDDDKRGFNAAGLGQYLRQMRLLDTPPQPGRNVSVVVAAGEIVNGVQAPGVVGGESTANLLRRARLDDDVSAVVLRIDSPGGSSFAAEQIRNEVEALRAAGKPVVASMSSTAASGGYWIAMAADAIYARESTLTGSIGVFLMLPTFQRTLDGLGVATDGVGSTAWAGAFRVDTGLDDDAREFLQNFVEEGYDEFISLVAEYRDMDKAAVDAVAQGQVWTGATALQHGLVDALGGLEAAVGRAAQIAELGDEYGMQYLEQELSPAERMIVDLLGGAARLGIDIAAFRPKPPRVAQRLLALLEGAAAPLFTFDDPRGLYSHCFCELR